MAAVAMTATGALSTAYAQQVSDGMDGYVVGDPDGGAGIYTGNPNECWYDTDDDGVPDMYCYPVCARFRAYILAVSKRCTVCVRGPARLLVRYNHQGWLRRAWT
jgi:hypothetical protein